MRYGYENTVYCIEVMQILAGKNMMVTVDGMEQQGNMITLTDDGEEHNVMAATIGGL